MRSPEPERNPICNVCEEIIADDEEFAECDCCEQPYHFYDCGGNTVAYSIDTYACYNCREYRNE